MRKVGFTFLMVALTSIAFAVSASDTIDAKNFNHALFEKTILEKINTYRVANGKKALIDNSLVHKIAKDHAVYLMKKPKISHNQTTPGKETIEKRFVYYTKAVRFTVGENVARTYVLRNAHNYLPNGTTKVSTAHTYDQAATYLFNAWKASKFHNKNMLSADYEISGISVQFNKKDSSITAVQVFAKL